MKKFKTTTNKFESATMRYLMIIIVFLLLPAVFFAQQTYVPDDNFEQALIDLGYDSGELNDSVPTVNIETVISLGVRGKNISDLTGIEDFTSLEVLYCSSNNIVSLNLSNNTALKLLWCYGNGLTSLNLSNNTALRVLNCPWNNLSSIDVSNNTALIDLWCYANDLTSIDVSNNTALIELRCFENDLTSIDVSNNTALKELRCSVNALSSIDMSNNSALESLDCRSNQLTSLNIKNGNNKNMQFEYYYSFDATGNPDLYCIQVDDSSWSANEAKWAKDDHAVYSEDCTKVGVKEFLIEGTEINIFPNPFINSTTINYTLEAPGNVRINIFDNLGTKIITLKEEYQDAGERRALFNAENYPQGMYYYTIQIGGRIESGKLLLIR